MLHLFEREMLENQEDTPHISSGYFINWGLPVSPAESWVNAKIRVCLETGDSFPQGFGSQVWVSVRVWEREGERAPREGCVCAYMRRCRECNSVYPCVCTHMWVCADLCMHTRACTHVQCYRLLQREQSSCTKTECFVKAPGENGSSLKTASVWGSTPSSDAALCHL